MNHRYDFVFLFDTTDGNPNGDPDAGNLPRVDPETGHGIVTDVCLKRKIRNFVQLTQNEQPGRQIYVREKAVLNHQHQLAYSALNLESEPKKLPKKDEDAKAVTKWMCQNFYDIRTFGAVMATEVNCGQVRGPVQFAFARSASPVVTLEHAVTRCAVTNEKDLEKERTMGRKFTIPYGLYLAHGFINPFLAKQTGWSDEDLALFKTALGQMFELDRSAARGLMGAKRCIAFKHATALGNAPAHKLFDLVKVTRKPGVEVVRKFSDYDVALDVAALPAGVSVEEWI
ncbi:type I-C CRISPR-associated protein Cas7/Csd2 [Horticoccus sp. 23ND18S-11]|uniref:type I-C CRISPR-associated protein Cas7/Csd2 n=1 Tax=Horticoccus sp. 23ND18S-11 TaxID=3391832 RepID=UPI0039C8E553